MRAKEAVLKKLSFVLVFFCILAALTAAPPAWADLTLITNRAALGANMSVDWSTLGAPLLTNISSPFTLGSVTVSMPSGTFQKLDQGTGSNDWNGNFSPGDHLLWTNYYPGPMGIAFSTPAYGVGANVQENVFGYFTAKLEVFSGTTSLGFLSLAGNSNAGNDGSAIFLGVFSSVPFTSLKYSITTPTGGNFVINQLGVRTTPVPIPPSALLFGTGLLLVLRIRKKK
jgi:hypothetical protein